jgi:hypothetical protein
MMPKKNRRNLHIDGVLWHYKTGDGWFVAQNSGTGQIVKHNIYPWKSKWGIEIKPSDVKEMIEKYSRRKK